MFWHGAKDLLRLPVSLPSITWVASTEELCASILRTIKELCQTALVGEKSAEVIVFYGPNIAHQRSFFIVGASPEGGRLGMRVVRVHGASHTLDTLGGATAYQGLQGAAASTERVMAFIVGEEGRAPELARPGRC